MYVISGVLDTLMTALPAVASSVPKNAPLMWIAAAVVSLPID